jgi:mono/diheme cytochrome c family protein
MTSSARVFSFEDEAVLLAGVATAAERGDEVVEVYAPHEVAALALQPPAALRRACVTGAIVGGVAAGAFQWWANALDWPLNVGGRPRLAWPAWVPVTFELSVLVAALAIFFSFVRAIRAGPSAAIPKPYPGTEGVRYVLVTRSACAAAAQSVDASTSDGAYPGVGSPRETRRWRRLRGRPALAGVAALALAAAWLVAPRSERPPPEQARGQAGVSADAPPVAQSESRAPVAGTVARGEWPFRYAATEADAARAGRELTKPLAALSPDERRLGAALYGSFCRTCHGRDGHGDGPTIRLGYQLPPSLLTRQARDVPDGRMFHVLTHGQKLMPGHVAQLSVEQRWLMVRYIRDMQARLPVTAPLFTAPPATGPVATGVVPP